MISIKVKCVNTSSGVLKELLRGANGTTPLKEPGIPYKQTVDHQHNKSMAHVSSTPPYPAQHMQLLRGSVGSQPVFIYLSFKKIVK